jgi:hypothetical protein
VKSISYRPHVWPDILAAGKWYERAQPGLGGDFVDEVEQFFDKIRNSSPQFPLVWPKYLVQRCLLDRFPYAIYFIEHSGNITVIAVVHSKRAAREWKRHAR